MFTIRRYEEMVHQLLGRGYRFASFTDAEELLREKVPFVLMRHDVDMDLNSALDLAEIETAAGVRATNFLLLRSLHYNVFWRENTAIVHRLIGLGQEIGLHFDCAVYGADADVGRLSKACATEVQILERWFGIRIRIVSYHRPSQLVLSGDPALSAPLPHTYLPLFTTDMQYFSDSQGRWRFGNPLKSEAFLQAKPLHLLVHPVWWGEKPMRPYEVLRRFVKRRRDELEQSLSDNCMVYRVGALKRGSE